MFCRMDNIFRIIKKNDTISFPFVSLKKNKNSQTIQFSDFSRKSDAGLIYLRLDRMCSTRTASARLSPRHTFLRAAHSRGLQLSVYQAGQRCTAFSLLSTLLLSTFCFCSSFISQELACHFWMTHYSTFFSSPIVQVLRKQTDWL